MLSPANSSSTEDDLDVQIEKKEDAITFYNHQPTLLDEIRTRATREIIVKKVYRTHLVMGQLRSTQCAFYHVITIVKRATTPPPPAEK